MSGCRRERTAKDGRAGPPRSKMRSVAAVGPAERPPTDRRAGPQLAKEGEALRGALGYNGDVRRQGGRSHYGQRRLAFFNSLSRFRRCWCVGRQDTSQRWFGDNLKAGALSELRYADISSSASTVQVANAIGWMDVPQLRKQDGQMGEGCVRDGFMSRGW
jgi:hypothetical protein